MPVTTRRQSRASVDTSAIHDRDGVRLPDISRSKAEAIARCIHPSPIENLPSEIIEAIADILRYEALEEEGRPAGFYKAASEFSDSEPPPCKCQQSQTVMRSYPSCEPSIPLSSTSRRFRQVVFDNSPGRMKVIKYCVHSLQMSGEMSEVLRGKVRELCVRATGRHIVPFGEAQLNYYLRLFPNVHELHLDWETILEPVSARLKSSEMIHDLPNLTKLVINSDADMSNINLDFSVPLNTWMPAVEDLRMLFMHLPLEHVKHLDLRIHDWINSRHLDQAVAVLRPALDEMRFPRMDIFSVSITIEVRSVRGCIWTEIEKTYAATLRQDTITHIDLYVYLAFAGCASIASGEAIFTPRENSHDDISPLLLPTENRLERLFQALQGSCKNLRMLDVFLVGESAHPDDMDEDKSYNLLTFRIAEDSDDHPIAPPNTTCYPKSGVVNDQNQKVTYEIHQDSVDKLARMVKVRMDEAGPDFDDIVNQVDAG